MVVLALKQLCCRLNKRPQQRDEFSKVLGRRSVKEAGQRALWLEISSSFSSKEKRGRLVLILACSSYPFDMYLDENNRLIYAIIDDQNLGKLEESARHLERLQQNLTYLAAIADNQPPQISVTAQYPPNMVAQPVSQHMQPQQAQFYPANATVQPVIQLIQPQQAQQCPASVIIQPGSQFMQTQQAQQVNPQILMVTQPVLLHDSQPQLAQPLMLQDQMSQRQFSQPALLQSQICHPQFAQQVMLHGQTSQPQLAQPVLAHDQISQPQLTQISQTLLQQQMQQAALHGQMEMISGGTSGLSMVHAQTMGGGYGTPATGGIPSVGSSSGAGNILAGNSLSVPLQGAGTGGGSMTMPPYISNSGQGNWGVGSG